MHHHEKNCKDRHCTNTIYSKIISMHTSDEYNLISVIFSIDFLMHIKKCENNNANSMPISKIISRKKINISAKSLMMNALPIIFLLVDRSITNRQLQLIPKKFKNNFLFNFFKTIYTQF